MLQFVGSQRVGHDLVTELKKKIGIGKRIQTNWGGGGGAGLVFKIQRDPIAFPEPPPLCL